MTSNNQNPHDDPEEGRDIDQEIRINELRHEIEERGGTYQSFEDNLPPDIEEQFLQRIKAFDDGPFATHLELLTRDGVVLFPPEEVTDEAMPGMIRLTVEALAKHQTFLLSTDHLSDREFYTYLWRDALREETIDLPPDPYSHCHIDLVSSGSDEDIDNWMRYYADEATRQDWIKQFPDYELPPHEDPPYDRDRFLPKAVYPTMELQEGEFEDFPPDGEPPF